MSRSGRFIGWFFLVFTITWYTQSSMATTLTGLNSKLEPNKFYNQSLTNLSKAVDLQEQNNQGFDGNEYNIMEKQDHVVMKGQRGKGTGVYGGGNVVHRRPPVKNSASLPAARPTSLFNIVLINIVITLHLIIVSSLFFIPN